MDTCTNCGFDLPRDSTDTVCPPCQEQGEADADYEE